jgi:hypothetical protein
VLRAARLLGFTVLGLLAATLALLTIAGALTTDLFSDGVGVDLDSQFWGAVVFTAVAATLCLVDLTALVVAVRGRRLLALYRRERDDWREVRAAQGSLLSRR